MGTLKITALMLLTLVLGHAACDDPTSCTPQERVVEVTYGYMYDFQKAVLEDLREQGWICNDDGTIRDAFGRVLGHRYRCTGCF